MLLQSWFPGTQHLRFAGALSGLAQPLIRYVSILYNDNATLSAFFDAPSDEQLTTPLGINRNTYLGSRTALSYIYIYICIWNAAPLSDSLGCKETPPLRKHPCHHLLLTDPHTSLWEENKPKSSSLWKLHGQSKLSLKVPFRSFCVEDKQPQLFPWLLIGRRVKPSLHTMRM